MHETDVRESDDEDPRVYPKAWIEELDEGETREEAQEIFRLFDESIDAASNDLSVFTLAAQAWPNGDARQGLSRAGNIMLIFLLLLITFLMIVVPLFIYVETEEKFRCKNRAGYRERLTAFGLITYLWTSVLTALFETQVLIYFASLADDRRAWIYWLGAMVKVMCSLSVLLATTALFVIHPRVEEMLLNAVAFVFLLEIDATVVKAMRSWGSVMPYYVRARNGLQRDFKFGKIHNRDVYITFAKFPSRSIAAKCKMLVSAIAKGQPFVAIYVFANVLLWTAGVTCLVVTTYCLPKPSDIDL